MIALDIFYFCRFSLIHTDFFAMFYVVHVLNVQSRTTLGAGWGYGLWHCVCGRPQWLRVGFKTLVMFDFRLGPMVQLIKQLSHFDDASGGIRSFTPLDGPVDTRSPAWKHQCFVFWSQQLLCLSLLLIQSSRNVVYYHFKRIIRFFWQWVLSVLFHNEITALISALFMGLQEI